MEENLKTTDELLEDVVNANLQDLLINQFDDEKQKKEVFDDTMKAVDRLTRMKEISSSEDKAKMNDALEQEKLKMDQEKLKIEQEKLEHSKRMDVIKNQENAKSDKKNFWLKVGEIAVTVIVPIGTLIGNSICYNHQRKEILKFEETGVITSTPGKKLMNKLFK